jgi:hypothetical protein
MGTDVSGASQPGEDYRPRADAPGGRPEDGGDRDHDLDDAAILEERRRVLAEAETRLRHQLADLEARHTQFRHHIAELDTESAEFEKEIAEVERQAERLQRDKAELAAAWPAGYNAAPRAAEPADQGTPQRHRNAPWTKVSTSFTIAVMATTAGTLDAVAGFTHYGPTRLAAGIMSCVTLGVVTVAKVRRRNAAR